jgi:CPA1 family monovalent cation:H+ antiporter
VRWLGLLHRGQEERSREIQAEIEGREAALTEIARRLDSIIAKRELPEEVIDILRTRNNERLQILPKDMQDALHNMRLSAGIKKELIDAERDFIYQLLRDGKITDEARRRIEYELDLEEASLANRGKDGGGWM